MSFDFVEKVMCIGSGSPSPILQFYKKGFNLDGSIEPTWQDIILSGNTALTLVNAKANSLEYLKLFGDTEQLPEQYLDTVTLSGGCEQRNLPVGYTQVEYIEASDGTAWLDTGFIANGGMVFDGKVLPVDRELSIGSIGPGNVNADLTRNLITYTTTGGGVYTPQKLSIYRYTYTDAGTSPAVIHLDTTGTNFYCTVNGNVVANTTTGTLTDQTTTVKIGYSDYSDTMRKGRYYPLQFRNSNGDLVRDLVPAKNSSNVVSMYDLVSNTFLPVQGTGTFTAGADVTTPSPDTPMDIVCNNGAIKYGTQGSNLFDETTITTGHYYNDNLEYVSSQATYLSDYIPVLSGKQYALFSVDGQTSGKIRINYFNSSKQIQSQYVYTIPNTGTWTVTIIIPSGINYMRFSAGTTYEDSLTFYQYGIYTDGTQEVVTDSVGNTANAEMLLAVGDYKDTQEVLTGSVTRNVGIKVLDGTEEWNNQAVVNCWSTTADNLASVSETNRTIYCNYFQSTSTVPVNRQGYCFKGHNSGSSFISFGSVTQFSTVTKWNNWLATQYANGTPVIIVYPTNSATTETVTPQLLLKSPVTQTAGSIDNLPIAITESSHTVPTPQQPLQINCNNGVVKVSKNLFTRAGETLDKYIDSSGNEQDGVYPNYSFAHTDYIKVQPNTTYTFAITSVVGAITNHRIIGWTANKTFIQQEANIATPAGGGVGTRFNTTFTTGATTEYITINYVYAPNDEQQQLELGSTATAYTPYYPNGIYTDGTTETVEIPGKNLFDVSTITLNYYYNDSGEWTLNTAVYTSAPIYVGAGATVTLSRSSAGASTYLRIHAFNSNNEWIGLVSKSEKTTSLSTTGTTPVNTAYIRVCGGKSPSTGELDVNIQLELGSTATTYEPYTVLGTATAENLFKVGTYQDVQSVIDGGVTRNVGIKVLDGTEDWVYVNSRFRLTISDYLIGSSIMATIISHYKLPAKNVGSIANGEARFSKPSALATVSDNNVFIVHDDNYTDLNSYKAWLSDQYNAGTPVIIVYPLATPTTSTVTPQPMNIQEGTNNVTITEASMDGLELEVKYKAGVSVTITEIQNAQLDDNVEVTING